jgi:RHS repeat-associated protein
LKMWISWSFWTETLGPHAPKSLVLLLRNSWSFWSEICTNNTGSVNTKYYYYPDRIGSVYMVCDDHGMLLEKENADAFGNSKTVGISKYGLTSNMYDTDTGLYYFHARWYDGKTGRFLEMDPVLSETGLINMYEYCANNPSSLTDRYGKFFELFGFDSDQDFLNGLTYDILHKDDSGKKTEKDFNDNKTADDNKNNYCNTELVNDIVNGKPGEEINRKIANDALPDNYKNFEPTKIHVSTPNAKYAGYFITAVGITTLAAGAYLTFEATKHGPLGGLEVGGTGFMMLAGAWMTGIGIEIVNSAKELENNEKK